MPIILVLMLLCFSAFANSSENCECNLLIIHHSDGPGNHHFTKQSEKIKGQDVYSSLSGDVIWWNDEKKNFEYLVIKKVEKKLIKRKIIKKFMLNSDIIIYYFFSLYIFQSLLL